MSFKYLIVVVVHIFIIDALGEYKSYDGYKLYEVIPKTNFNQNQLRGLSLSTEAYDVWSMPKQLGLKSEIMVPPELQQNFEIFLQKFNISHNILMDNVETMVQKERFLQTIYRAFNRGIKFNQYYRYDDILDYLESLEKKYSQLVTVTTIGKSFENRDLKTIRISNGNSSGKKKTIFIDAGIHAREWIAPATALYIIHELVENNSKNENLLKTLDWVILPVVNPDGYEYTHTKDRYWRKTRKPAGSCFGTDGNRNFDFHWGEIGASPNACSETFRGEEAFSEPETISLRNALQSLNGDCKFYLTLHSYGQYMLYPWGYTDSLPNTWKEIDEVARAGAQAIQKATGTKYTVGSSTNVLYAAAGGSDDYALGVEKIPISITMELPSGRGGGNGFDPPQSQIKAIVQESWIGIKAMALLVDEKFET